ncbi:(E3-independent) E2 ubiquitin-conjugating enzyme UBE2O-like isoform X2 [Saccostrea cucullata]|uniref:(E3-independent) E2 ubiquitin-conjugating enzyme UBE2O-like isoform X2 n=1 Tax=Saccostrea cuccullata TaxID=36930 RepID=UPI002ED0527E
MADGSWSLFEEDEVCRKTSDGSFMYGIVTKNSLYMSSDEEEEDEDRLEKGKVRVSWHPSGKESVVSESELILTDRSLMPGDVIRRFEEGAKSQRGFVQDLMGKCHIHIRGTNKFLYNVNSKDLCSMKVEEIAKRPLSNSFCDVVMDSWVGKVERVNEELILKFPDGALCKVQDTDQLDDFEPVKDHYKSLCSSDTFLYKGLVMKGTIGDLSDAVWLSTTHKHGPKAIKKSPNHTVTVRIEEARLKSVEVYWMCRGFTKSDNPLLRMTPPPSLVQEPDLQRLQILDWFSHCSLQIGDFAQYVIKPSDDLSDIPPKLSFIPDILLNNPVAQNELAESQVHGTKDYTPDVKTEAKALVNGEVPNEAAGAEDDEYEDVETTESETEEEQVQKKHSSTRNRHKGRKGRKSGGKKGAKRAKQTVKFEPEIPKCLPGEKVAVGVCYTFSLATVMWQDGTMESDIPSPVLFPIHYLDELEFFPGDYVVDAKEVALKNCDYGVVVSCNHKERTCFVKWIKTVDIYKGERPEENVEPVEVSAYDLKDHPDFKFRPAQTVIRVIDIQEEGKEAVGQIHSLDPQGAIYVRWPSGEITRCYPQELYIVGDEMSEFDSSSWSTEEEEETEEDDDSNMSWETEDEEAVSSDEIADGGISLMFITKEKKEELDALMSRAQTALENLQKIFFTYTGKITITYRYLRDIIAVYKRCQDLEKILKSHFFEDVELTNLLEEIRSLMYDEKRNELNDRLLKIYEKRKGGGSMESPSKEDSSVSQTLEDYPSHVFLETSKPSSPDTELTQLANAIVQSVMKTFTASQVQNQEARVEENANLPNGDIDNPCLGATSADFIPKTVNTSEETASNTTSNGEPEKWQVHQEGLNVSNETKELNVSQESGLEVSDCDSGLGESKGSGASLDRDNWVSKQKKKEEVCKRFCQLMLVQMVKIRGEIGERWEKTKEWMGKECDKCEQNRRTDKPENEESPGARLVEELDLAFNPESNCVECDQAETQEETADISDHREEVETYKQVISVTHGFQMCETAPSTHNFASKVYSPQDPKSFLRAVRKEYQLLQSNLPNGIIVKGFEDRMDLFSVMIIGPHGTPYEDGLFFFDVFLPADYPTSPPVFHYISYCTDRLNPNLYEDGKVCVSLLGTWDGKGSEMWTAKSNMLQVLVSIQGLILVAEPYYNEAGFEKQRGSVIGDENSKMYNEMAIIKLVQSLTRMIENPPHSFKEEMISHLKENAERMIHRYEYWLESSIVNKDQDNGVHVNCDTAADPSTGGQSTNQVMDTAPPSTHPQLTNSNKEAGHFRPPEFSLFPPSKGFCIPMKKYLETFKQTVKKNILSEDAESTVSS